MASTLKLGPRYLLIVLALVGDSTMTRSCLNLPLVSLLTARGFLAAPVLLTAAGTAFLRPVAEGFAALFDGFLRAGTDVSPGCCCVPPPTRYNHSFEPKRPRGRHSPILHL